MKTDDRILTWPQRLAVGGLVAIFLFADVIANYIAGLVY